MHALQDDTLLDLFVDEDSVPAEARPPRLDEPTWLVDGEVRPFDGPSRVVSSRVATRRGGELAPTMLGREPLLGPREVDLAIEAAERAYRGGEGEWPSLHVEARMAATLDFASAVEKRAEDVARLLMWEIGKPAKSARDEVSRSVEYIRETVKELAALRAADLEVLRGLAGGVPHVARTHRRPIGVVLAVAPFNYPVNEFLTTIVPALLMGNVVLAKTPRFGVLANTVLFDAFREAFPRGVVSVLPGEGRAILPALMGATRTDVAGNPTGVVQALAFIGSEGAANAILRAHPAPITLHKVLGLGAKNAAVVLPDADLSRAVPAIVKGALGFNGQRCTAEKIVFVHRSLFDRFVEDLAARVAALPLGMPWTPGVAITPLPEEHKLDAMRALLDDATAQGASIRNEGGGRGAHSLMRPAVVAEVKPGMRLYHEEQFGPIVPVAAFDDVEEVLEWQRRSPYGQQAVVWGSAEGSRALVRRLTRFVARVNVNDVCQRGPDSFGFSAADKSGFGTLSLREALLAFSRPVLVQATDTETLEASRARPAIGG
jgi:glyceraldehyde-3-phosphate dehydrogenase (NADP+)